MSSLKPIRRLVAGNNAAGSSVVLIDGAAPNSHPSSMSSARGHTDLWVWDESPLGVSDAAEAGKLKYVFPGGPQGGSLSAG